MMRRANDRIDTIKPEITVEKLPHTNQTAQEGLRELLTLLMDLNHIDIQTQPKTYHLYVQKVVNALIEVTDQLNTLTEMFQVKLLLINDQINNQIPTPFPLDEFVTNFIRELSKGRSEQVKNEQS